MRSSTGRWELGLGLAGGLWLGIAAPAFAELHIQCARTRCKLPVRNYTTREPVQGALVTSPLTASVTVEQVLPPSKAALVPPDELDALLNPATGNSLALTEAQRQAVISKLLQDSGLTPRPTSSATTLRSTTSPATISLPPAASVPAAAATPSAPELIPVSTSPASEVRRSIRSKTLRLGRSIRLPNGVNLEQASLTIYETGEAAVNGLLWHDGGPYASRLGSNVKISIRAMGATDAYEVGPADGPLFWETTDERWVPRGKPQRLKLSSTLSPEIRAHFDEINRLEVNLESPTIR